MDTQMRAPSEVYSTYKELNKRLVRGAELFWRGQGSPCPASATYRSADRVLRYPRIGVYVGSGTSHSWLWFVELFDRMGFYDVVFLNEDEIRQDGLKDLDILAMSGGDTFAVAEGLGIGGSQKLKSFDLCG
jgi:hypothetical protein